MDAKSLRAELIKYSETMSVGYLMENITVNSVQLDNSSDPLHFSITHKNSGVVLDVYSKGFVVRSPSIGNASRDLWVNVPSAQLAIISFLTGVHVEVSMRSAIIDVLR